MRRLAWIPVVLLAACQPSHAQVAQMEARLVELEHQQGALQAEVQALESNQRATQEEVDTAAVERRRIRSFNEDLSGRVTGLEASNVPRIQDKQKPTPGRPDPQLRYAATIGDAHTRGPADALVTIVVFSDFQCPFCARVVDTLTKVETEYGQDVRLVFKHNPLPFHQEALPAALASEAAGRQGKFWKMHDLLFKNQRELHDDDLERFAKKLRLNRKKFKRDLKNQKLKTKVDEHKAQAAKLGARGTPAFFINGRFLSGAQPFDSFSVLIDEELVHARKVIRAGTPRSKVYETLMRDALPGV